MINENDIKLERNEGKEVLVSFRNHGNLSLLKHDYFRFTLMEQVRSRGTRLIMDLTGIKTIDSASLDTLNLLSRLGRKYDSSIWLKGVEPEIIELLKLARKYSVFDIQHIEAVNEQVA